MTNLVSMADLRAQLTAKLQAQANTLPPPTTTKIKAKAKEGFHLPDGTLLDELEAVVLDMRYLNTYYAKRFVPGVIESPSCWAISDDANNMIPDDSSVKKQSDSCNGCPMAEWGSAGAGSKGKACSNKIRIALVPPDATAESPIWTLDLAPTSIASYIKAVRELKIPMQTVVMRFSLDSKVDYPKIITELLGPAEDSLAPHLVTLMSRAVEPVSRGLDYDA